MERKKFKNVYTGIAAVYLLLLVLRGGKCWTVAEDYCYRLAWPSLAWPFEPFILAAAHDFHKFFATFSHVTKVYSQIFHFIFFCEKMQNFAKKVCEI